ncbi:MAG: hypothetical protein JXR38_04405 [Bacilli bacterium]|nr:hypothetical protein [Bacilli bacterium]
MIKKALILITIFFVAITIIGCSQNTTTYNSSTTVQTSVSTNIDSSTNSTTTSVAHTSSMTTSQSTISSNVVTSTTEDPSMIYQTLFTGDWNRPGLFNEDGSEHVLPEEVVKTGITLDVTAFGAIPDDPSFNNYFAFKDAIDAALPGDEVYVPGGTYYFTGSKPIEGYYTHIDLKSGIIFRGAGELETTLVSVFSETSNQTRETTVISVINASNISLSGFTITSLTDDADLPDPNNSGLISNVFSAPKYGITIDSPRTITSSDDQSHNVVVRDITIEKFQRMGIRLRLSREVLVDGVSFQKAVNLGGGGAGYGISIQGSGYNTDWTGTAKDSVWNVVRNSNFVGPWLRHGVVIQYHSHNNLIDQNSFKDLLLDSIDMHGEDEYSNEIRYNLVENTRQGAGVGVGNSGATHDASGRNNFIHHNTIDGGLRGIDVLYGSPQTVIFANLIRNLDSSRSVGVLLSDAPYTYIVQNEFVNILGDSEGVGIKINYAYYSLDPTRGIPDHIWILSNHFNTLAKGIFVETHGDDFFVSGNTFAQIEDYEFQSTRASFIIPEASELMIPKYGFELVAMESNFITTEDPNGVQSQKNMKFKATLSEPSYNRMIFAKFDLTEVPTYTNVYLCFTAKAQEGMPTINIWGSTSYLDWSMTTITWNNSRLHESFVAKTLYDDEVDNLTKIVDFTFPIAVYAFNTYYVDITDYILNVLDNPEFTMVMSNDAIEGVYMEVYNHLQTSTNQHLRLIFTTEENG